MRHCNSAMNSSMFFLMLDLELNFSSLNISEKTYIFNYFFLVFNSWLNHWSIETPTQQNNMLLYGFRRKEVKDNVTLDYTTA